MKALWFSGGKDSLACLYLYRHELPDIHVIFANTGQYYPEQLAVAQMAKLLSHHWHEVKTDRRGQWALNGLPSDVVPIDWTTLGQQISGAKPSKVQSYLQCCYENITSPLMAKTRELGCTDVICGQRADEPKKAPRKHGDVVEGIKFLHPIEDWTREHVMAYLRENGAVPEHFALEHSSMDCFDCTAYAAHSQDRVAYTRERHPDLYAQYRVSASRLRRVLDEAMRPYSRMN